MLSKTKYPIRSLGTKSFGNVITRSEQPAAALVHWHYSVMINPAAVSGECWINCHSGPTAQSDTADQTTCKPSMKVCREDSRRGLKRGGRRRGRKRRWRREGAVHHRCYLVEPVALREFHRRLHGNTRPLHGWPDVSYHCTKPLPLVAATYNTCLVFHDASAVRVYWSLRRGADAAADVTCQAASTFPVASSPLQDEVFVVLLGHPQFEGIFEQNLFGFEPHCSEC